MTPGAMILAAKKQQDLTGKKDADVAFVIPGKWPEGGMKRLAGVRGPLGRCRVEYEDGVMCLFKADAVIAFCSKYIPALSIRMAATEPKP